MITASIRFINSSRLVVSTRLRSRNYARRVSIADRDILAWLDFGTFRVCKGIASFCKIVGNGSYYLTYRQSIRCKPQIPLAERVRHFLCRPHRYKLLSN